MNRHGYRDDGLLPLLIAELVKIADAGQYGRHIPCLERHDTGSTFEKGGTVLVQRVAIRGGKPDAGDDDPVGILKRFDHDSSNPQAAGRVAVATGTDKLSAARRAGVRPQRAPRTLTAG